MRAKKAMNWLAAALFALSPVLGQQPEAKRRSDLPPRKVIVGTAMRQFWGPYPGLEKQLKELAGLVDRMAEESHKRYGRGLDVAVLPETAVSGESLAHAVALSGPLKELFSKKARQVRSYIVVPTYLADDPEEGLYSNSAVLFGRHGDVVGIYRKMHLAVHTGSDSLEGGTTPGRDVPVFDTDFGRLGIQICFDIEFDRGWEGLARKGADLVVWPTQSPQTAQPAFRAKRFGYYVVSSTWRHNASIFEPTGRIVSQIKAPDEVLVQEVDLSFAILPWSPKLKNGEAMSAKYGGKVGYRYYEEEDRGIFWSNDPQLTVGQMVRSMGLAEADSELERIKLLYRKAGVPGY